MPNGNFEEDEDGFVEDYDPADGYIPEEEEDEYDDGEEVNDD